MVKQFSDLSAADVQAYLSRGWLTHDGMWLFNAYNSVGIEKANELNRAAIRSMAFLEMKRTRKILEYEERPSDIHELEHFIKEALGLLLPPDLCESFTLAVTGPSAIRWQWEKESCFAYKGIKRINMLDQYKCGVIYRIECWLESFGFRHEVSPRIDGCLMKENGECGGELIIKFSE